MALPAMLGILALVLAVGVPPEIDAAPRSARKATAKKKPSLIAGSGVIVTLKTGALIEGVYHGDADGAVWVEVDGGEVGIEKTTIAGIVPAQTGSIKYKERAAALGAKDRDGWWKLSVWAAARNMHGAAATAARTVVNIDPEHAGAREYLGFEKVGERWLQGDAIPAAKGLVQFERRWLTQAEVADIQMRRRNKEMERSKNAEYEYQYNLQRLAPKMVTEKPVKKSMGWIETPARTW